jgi:hypothetical protein
VLGIYEGVAIPCEWILFNSQTTTTYKKLYRALYTQNMHPVLKTYIPHSKLALCTQNLHSTLEITSNRESTQHTVQQTHCNLVTYLWCEVVLLLAKSQMQNLFPTPLAPVVLLHCNRLHQCTSR